MGCASWFVFIVFYLMNFVGEYTQNKCCLGFSTFYSVSLHHLTSSSPANLIVSLVVYLNSIEYHLDSSVPWAVR
jgi:hypothetical protein